MEPKDWPPSVKVAWYDECGSYREGELSSEILGKLNEVRKTLQLSSVDVLIMAINDYHRSIIGPKRMNKDAQLDRFEKLQQLSDI